MLMYHKSINGGLMEFSANIRAEKTVEFEENGRDPMIN
jgi:hypothetical protein